MAFHVVVQELWNQINILKTAQPGKREYLQPQGYAVLELSPLATRAADRPRSSAPVGRGRASNVLVRRVLSDACHLEVAGVAGAGPTKVETVNPQEGLNDILAAAGGEGVVPGCWDFDGHSFFESDAAHLGGPTDRHAKECHKQKDKGVSERVEECGGIPHRRGTPPHALPG